MDPYWRSTRAFIVHRDENNGYGLTVSGDNPVAVQTIKRGGAADLAGIKEGDIIIKVNGALVDHLNHTEVVELIRSAGAYVTLTVRPADIITMPGMTGNSRSHHLQTPHERVTAPLPANHDVQVQMQCSKWRMLQAMRDEAAADADKLLEKFTLTQHHKDLMDFEKAKQRLEDIKMNMKAFRQSSPNLQLHSPVPFNVAPQSHHSVSFHPHFSGMPGGSGLPPSNVTTALPGQRNRNPLSVHSVISGYPRSWDHNDQPPPLPPRSFSQSFSTSDNVLVNPPGYSIHDPLGLGQHVLGQPVNLNTPNSQSSSGLGHKSYHASTNNDVANNKSPNSSLSSQQQQQQQPQTHHRTKSSPDPVSMQKALNAAEASRRSDSVSDLSKNNNSRSRGSVAWDSVDPSNCLSPSDPCPGSPPPPYKHDPESGVFIEENNSFNNVNFSTSDFSPTKTLASALANRPNQFSCVDIISMEEDDGLFSRDAGLNSSFGHYSSLSKLLEHNAHLAVFMNYVIDNKCDPSSLLFYLITGLYINEGNIKEMKRWAYEIHSTFTAPGSPLLVPHVDENIAKEIDDGLVNECDKEEMMRRVFRKARNKAKEEINKQLEEFSTKMTAGLGTMFGPPDSELEQSLNDKVKEQRIVYEYLLPRLEHLYEDWEKNLDDRTLAIVNAGATVVQKQFGVRSSSANSVIEKCSSFVSKEKSMRHKLLSKNKKVSFNGHHFTPQYYYSYTECNICCKLLWGVGPQGFACLNCNVNIHRNCLSSMQDNCVGSVHKKDKANDKLRKLKERIRPDRRTSSNWSMKKWPEDSLSTSNSISSADIEIGDRPLSTGGTSSSNLRGVKTDQRPDTLSEERTTNDGFVYEDEDIDRVQQEPKKSSIAVGRSESCKERVQRRQTRERRKHSDPNLTSKSSDADLENQRHLSDANNSGSSSNSSLSGRSLDSPSTSLGELVVGPSCHSSSLRNSETPETGHSGVISDSVKPSPGWEGDSDIEIDQDPPDWTKNVPEAELRRLDRLEKKRQEVLNELFHTERSHVRNLKVVDRLFHRPIRQQQLVPSEIIHMLFANLEDMLEVHEQFNTALKTKRKENPLVSDIGLLLLEMFDGEKGNIFKQTAAYFCAKQQIGLELFKERRRKDPKFHAFLLEAESDPVCRRLQITDMIPMVMQRLTKYPLLFENLCNCTDQNSEEYKNIQRAVELSKEILNSVNLAKKEAEDRQRLFEIQRRLDKSSLDNKGFDKADPAIINELKNLDFTSHKLIYEGPLSWRMTRGNKQKSDFHDVQAILLDDLIVLLLRENDRFVLKIHNLNFAGKTDRVVARPIIRLHNLILREAAADKKAFFLLNTTSSNMNMYELWCPSTEDRKIWLHHITKAAEDYKSRQQESRREIHPNVNIPTIPPIVSESDDRPSKDNLGGDMGESSGDTSGEAEQQQGQESHQKDDAGLSPAPETSNTSSTAENAAASSPETSKNAPPGGKGGRLSVTNGQYGNNKQARSYSVSPTPTPSPNRRKGEFLHVTVSSSPLVSPSEVVVATRNVQFAQPVVSQYEELKRVNASINKAFDEKLRLVEKLSNIPADVNQLQIGDISDSGPSKDAKDLVVACIHQVDQLGRILSGQVKITNDNLSLHREQFAIQKNLQNLLTQLLSEVQRRDEDSESRRQELHRIREQNHGLISKYQAEERLNRSKVDCQPSPGQLSPTSPSHSRPNSFLSDHHDDDPVVMKPLLKPQLCDNFPVATCSSNQPFSNSSSIPLPIDTDGRGDPYQTACNCDLAQEEFVDAEEELVAPDVINKAESVSTSVQMSPSCVSGSEDKNEGEPHGNGKIESESSSKIVTNLPVSQVPEDKIEKQDEKPIVCSEDEDKSKTNGHGSLSSSSEVNTATTTIANSNNCLLSGNEVDEKLDKSIYKTGGVLGEGDCVDVVTKNAIENDITPDVKTSPQN